MEDLPVGSEIVLKVVESNTCKGCFFAELDSDIYENACKRIKCGTDERKDEKSVQFKKERYMVKRNVTITLEKAIEWYNSGDESLKDLALQAFTKEELIYNFRDITTFKKACDILDYNYDDIVSKVNSIAEISKASAAMFKLNIVRKALNLGYDMHISRNVDGQKYSHYPFFALVIKGSTCYRGAKEIDKYEKLGEFTSERTIYEIFHVGVYSDIDYKGLGKYNPDRRYSFINIDTGLLGCATEDISRHLGKYFGMLIMEAMYADIVDFEIVEEKYKI